MRVPSPPLTFFPPFSALSPLPLHAPLGGQGAHAHASLSPLGGQGVPRQTGSPNEIFGNAASLLGGGSNRVGSEHGSAGRVSSGYAGVYQVDVDDDDASDEEEDENDGGDDDGDDGDGDEWDDRSDDGDVLDGRKRYAYTSAHAGVGATGHGDEDDDGVTVVLGSNSTSTSGHVYPGPASGAPDQGLDQWDLSAFLDYEGGIGVGLVEPAQVEETRSGVSPGKSSNPHSTTAAPATLKPASGRLLALGKIQHAARGRRARTVHQPFGDARAPSPSRLTEPGVPVPAPAPRGTMVSAPTLARAPAPSPAKPKTKRGGRPPPPAAPGAPGALGTRGNKPSSKGVINPEDIPIPAHLRAVRSSSRLKKSVRCASAGPGGLAGPGAGWRGRGRGASPRVEQPHAAKPEAAPARGTSRVIPHKAEAEVGADSDSELSDVESSDGGSPGGSLYELPAESGKPARGKGRGRERSKVAGARGRVGFAPGPRAGAGAGRSVGGADSRQGKKQGPGQGKKRTRGSEEAEEKVEGGRPKPSKRSRTSRTAQAHTPPTSTPDPDDPDDDGDPADDLALEDIKPAKGRRTRTGSAAPRRRATNPARSRQNKEAQYRYRTKKKVVAEKTWDYAINIASLLSHSLRGHEKKEFLDLTDKFLASIDQGFAAEFLTATRM